MIELKGKTAFITGAAGGIGLGIAQALTREGAAVVLADIDGVEVEKAAATLRDQGAKALALHFDATDPAAWEDAKAQAERTFGPVRILCSNTGAFGASGPVESIEPKLWRWLFAINTDAHLHAARTFLPELKASGDEAHIVNTISMAGIFAAPMAGAYNATKFAALGLSMTLRNELIGTKIGVSVLCPGYVATRLAKTSLLNQPREQPADAAATEAFASALRQGMPPGRIGPRVVEAIKANEFYIFPHQSYRPVVEAVHRRQLASFNHQADPVDQDDISALLSII